MSSQLHAYIENVFFIIMLHLSCCRVPDRSRGAQERRSPFLLVVYLSLPHAPVFHRLMQMLWMHRNRWCIAAATVRWWWWVLPGLPPCCLRSNRNTPVFWFDRGDRGDRGRPPDLDPMTYPAPCKPAPLNPPLILLMSERHRCPHIGHQLWIKTQRFLSLFIVLMFWS